MKKEIRKEIKIIPAQVSIVEHVTYHYSCRACDKDGMGGFIKAAKSPNALFSKSLVSPSLLAYLINQKYTNGLPLYRQEQEFERLGVFLYAVYIFMRSVSHKASKYQYLGYYHSA